jgi:Sulfotransferase family
MSPVKEPGYFARDFIVRSQHSDWMKNRRGITGFLNGPSRRRGEVVLDWGSYLKLFRDVTHQVAIGEASTAYLISPEAPADIRAAIPHARIIILLRSHAERTFSTYLMLCRNGRLRASFSDLIRSEGFSSLADWRRTILETRKVAPGVERFLTTFPREQIRWYFYEELSTDPLAVMRSIQEFLGVDPGFKPDVTLRHNEGLLPKAPLLLRLGHITGIARLANSVTPHRARPFLRRVLFQEGPIPLLAPEDRAILVEYFREDIEKLSSLVGKDLSEWLRV